jgi:hypothetical protein
MCSDGKAKPGDAPVGWDSPPSPDEPGGTVTAFGTDDDAVSVLMDETEAAIKAAEDDMGEEGAESIEGGGWIDIVRCTVDFSGQSENVKSEVLRMHGLARQPGLRTDDDLDDWLAS